MLDLWLDMKWITIDEYVEIKKAIRGCYIMCYANGYHDAELLSLILKAIVTDVRLAKKF